MRAFLASLLLIIAATAFGANPTQIGMSMRPTPVWTPTNLSTTVHTWYDAEVFAGHANGTVESTWPDKSGNARTATIGGGGVAYYTNNVIGGRGAIRFHGNTRGTGRNYTAGSMSDYNPPMTAFFVLMSTGYYGDATGRSTIIADGADNQIYMDFNANLQIRAAGNNAGANNDTVANAYTAYVPFILTIDLNANGTLPTLYTNGVVVGMSATSTDEIRFYAQSWLASWGGDYYGNLFIGEVIIYDNPKLSAADRGKVEAYLRGKWGI